MGGVSLGDAHVDVELASVVVVPLVGGCEPLVGWTGDTLLAGVVCVTTAGGGTGGTGGVTPVGTVLVDVVLVVVFFVGVVLLGRL